MRIRPATGDDLNGVAELLSTRPEFVRADWELSTFELGRDAWVAEGTAALAGYAAVLDGGRLVLASGDPAVADALLALAVGRAAERGFDSLLLTVDGPSDHVERHPFRLERETLVMWRRLDRLVTGPEWPAGICVRTFEPPDAEAVHALLDEAYGAWDSRYAPLAHDDWLRWMTGDIDFDPGVWWLAERDGRPVGCALHWRTGWLKDLVVRETERGRGLGAALVQHGLAEFASRGVDRVGLKVDAGNPTGAVQLYERLGFVIEGREATWALSL